MKAWQNYFEIMKGVVEKAQISQGDAIIAASDVLAECTIQGGIIHLFGSGHSGLITEDVFWRAATLANVHAIFESSVAGINEITKTSKIEKLEGIGNIIVAYNRVAPPDVMICISNSGNNAVTIDVAIAARNLGVKVIAITNPTYADELTTHHSSGKKLKDVADLVIDNCSLYGDAAVELPGFPQKVGATSTIPVAFILPALLVQTCENVLAAGHTPDVYYNGHLAYEDTRIKEHNDNLVDKYFYRIRNL
ncbi:MAG: sugar isomerase domain-containing protein [Anaerolineaceae bacterium]|nr:sugar isomerase domain-containing protein [Anaerolineaceae bacterium]